MTYLFQPEDKPAAERRTATRFQVNQPAKLNLDQSLRFMPSLVINVSNTGALIETTTPYSPKPGDRIRVGLPPQSNQILRAQTMPEATVVRSRIVDGKTQIAVRFQTPQATMAAPFATAA